MTKKLHLFLTLLLLTGLSLYALPAKAEGEEPNITPNESGIIFVKENGAGLKNGSSWENATGSLSYALIFTNAYTEKEYTIRIAGGTYYPESTEGLEPYKRDDDDSGEEPTLTERDRTFLITSNVTLLGGYDPNGSGQRDLSSYETVLSGDLDKSKGLSDADAYHVVIVAGPADDPISPTLDGLTITGGNANGESNVTINGITIVQSWGGGIVNNTAHTRMQNMKIEGNLASGVGGGIYNNFSNPTLTRVVISKNTAETHGAGIYNNYSSPILTQVAISENEAEENGGGIHNTFSSPILTQVSITENRAYKGHGGGICNEVASSPILTHVMIAGNYAGTTGGGINNYSIFDFLPASMTLTQVTIIGNEAGDQGGGFLNSGGSSSTLTQVTIAGNKAGTGGGIYNTQASTLTFQNSVIWRNTAEFDENIFNNSELAFTYSLAQGITEADDEGNLDGNTDPGFVNWIDPATTEEWGPTVAGNYSLTATSPLIDAGSNALYEALNDLELPIEFNLNTDLDIAGNRRLCGKSIDIGAYEFQVPNTIYHNITLEVASGIELYNLTAGTIQVEEGSHLHLQFLPEDRTLGADDVLLLIDGVETSFKDFGANHYFSYILNPITQDHTVEIALREYTVTLPEVQGITYDVGAGMHHVAYGNSFTFRLTLADEIDPADVHVFANGQEIRANELRSTILTYTIDRVTTAVTVLIEGGSTTSNASLTHGVRLVIDNGQLTINNEMSTAVDVAVYSITGQNMVQLRALRGSKTIMLPAGIYIVRAGQTNAKVIIP